MILRMQHILHYEYTQCIQMILSCPHFRADNFVYGQEIMYMCNEGYTRVGPEVRRCGKINQKAAWTGFSPLCVGKLLTRVNYNHHYHQESSTLMMSQRCMVHSNFLGNHMNVWRLVWLHLPPHAY